MFYHDNQSKCLFLISLCSLRHNTWIYISSIDKPLYSISYLLNFPVVWKKCTALSLFFYPYFSLISETAVSETVVSEIMLMFIVWIIYCYLLIFDACFCIWKMCFSETAVSEVFYVILNSLLVLGFYCFYVCRIAFTKSEKTLIAHCWGYIRKSVFWTTLRSLLSPILALLRCEKKTFRCFKQTIAMFQVNHRNVLLALFRCFKHTFYVLGFYWG